METNVNNTTKPQHDAKLPVICRFFGHKAVDLNDSAHPVCERCGSHSYYDDWNKSAFLMRPIWFIQGKFYQFKCDVNYWYRRIFLGDTLPF
jgi:hypothetical protein